MDLNRSENFKRCVRCILPDHLPSVHLDEDGICNHCKTFDSLRDDWEKNKSLKKKELENLILRIKTMDRQYDCLVSLSGGKDSTFALYLMSKVYKLKCLCVTFDNGFLSEFARRNISKAVESTNSDHIYYQVNRENLLKLYNLSIKKSGQFCSVCMRGIGICSEFPLKAFNIPLRISGDGQRTSYLNSFPEVFQGGDAYHFTKMLSGDPMEEETRALLLTTDPLNERIIRKLTNILKRILKLKPTNSVIRLQLYDYVEFSPESILKTLQDEMGWTQPKGEYEHMDCLLHDLQHYVNTFKFEKITLHTFYRSYLIRSGIMPREEALSLEYEELRDKKEPEVLDSFLKQIKMSQDEFYSTVKDWKKLDKYREEGNRIARA